MCKLGLWDRSLPTCVRPGCDDISAPKFGALEFDLDGALARFECQEERELVGDSVLGCDGQYWNGTVPLCVPLTTTTTTTTTPKPATMSKYEKISSESNIVKINSKIIFLILSLVILVQNL